MFKLEFSTDNAAFDDDVQGEVARILRAVADGLEDGPILNTERPVRDVNGNTVGSWELS